MIVLRLIHIVSGVFWVGGSMISAFFLSPAIAASGEAGQKMMGYMVNKGHMTVRITGAAYATVLAGAVLYWIDSGGFSSGWTLSPTGIGFALGAILAVVGLVYGLMVGQSVKKMGEIAAAAKGQPTAEQLGEIQAAQRRMATSSRISTAALILALACMATARYWGI
jgi:uncharacterized membrane protein